MPLPENTIRFATVVLAAGRAMRMGRAKLLLPWGDTSVLGHIIGQWHNLGTEQVGVVHAVDDTSIPAEMHRLGCAAAFPLANQTPSAGMFSSVRCAALAQGWQSGLTHWVIVLGDQPHLQERTLAGLITFGVAHPQQVCQPQYEGHLAHPVLMPRSVFLGLQQTKSETLKDYLNEQAVAACACDDPGLALDIDTPEDYLRALQFAGLGNPQPSPFTSPQ